TFQRKVKQRFLDKINMSSNPKDIASLQNAIRNLETWSKNPERFYRENIKATRLEWLLDLKLLAKWDQERQSYSFRPESGLFFEETVLSDYWLNNIYPYHFYECFKFMFKKKAKKWEELSTNLRRQLLKKFLAESLDLFKPTSALPKISASQFFEYSIAMLLSKYCVIVNYEHLEKDIIKNVPSQALPYRFVKMISVDDIGYIVKEK
ncbi:MAG: hypothetical protein NZ903_02825, partial [Candidatus Micrarchaeota archaeon]|nr:hypothetical protein [Candidatus Micrarchaeota archaeon]